MKNVLAVSALMLAVASGSAMADERNRTVVGAVIGGAAGAAIGHHIEGRHGAIVGSAIGAATGVAIANSDNRRRADSDHGRDAYIYQDEDDDYERERVVYVQPEVRERVVYVQPRPVVVYRPAPVVYQAAPVYYRPARQVVRYEYRGHRHDNGHHYGHRKHWKHGGKRHHHHDD